MSISKPQILGLPVIAVVVTFVVLMVDAAIISSLRRPMQGELVTIPWAACIAGVLSTAVLLPWLMSLVLLRQPRTRIYFLVCLALAFAAWYFLFDFEHLLSKAYRRGL
jgi:hypothetical protein